MLDKQHPLIRKLERFLPLTPTEYQVLDGLAQIEEQFTPHQDIVSEGQVPRSVFVVLDGMACRYRLLPDGSRQIITFLLPGDLCDLHVFLLKAMDHSISTITNVRLASISRNALLQMAILHPRISASLWWSSLQEEAMLRERIVSLGRRDAAGRVAYLLCELVWRQQAISATNGSKITLPLTQIELADALGLTSVHINRILQRFRREGLLTLTNDRRLELADMDKMREIAQFNSNYLHFGNAPDDIRSYFDEMLKQNDGGAG